MEVEYLPHNDFDTLCNAYDLDMHAFNFEETYNYTDSQLQSSHEYYAGNPNGYQDILFNDALCLGMSLEILWKNSAFIKFWWGLFLQCFCDAQLET